MEYQHVNVTSYDAVTRLLALREAQLADCTRAMLAASNEIKKLADLIGSIGLTQTSALLPSDCAADLRIIADALAITRSGSWWKL